MSELVCFCQCVVIPPVAEEWIYLQKIIEWTVVFSLQVAIAHFIAGM
jgi:hypothetical protein